MATPWRRGLGSYDSVSEPSGCPRYRGEPHSKVFLTATNPSSFLAANPSCLQIARCLHHKRAAEEGAVEMVRQVRRMPAAVPIACELPLAAVAPNSCPSPLSY
jgi:hypothetical protein